LYLSSVGTYLHTFLLKYREKYGKYRASGDTYLNFILKESQIKALHCIAAYNDSNCSFLLVFIIIAFGD